VKSFNINGIEVFMEEATKYIQINDIQEKNLLEIWEYLRKHFPGYKLVLCFRNMAAPEKTLATIGAEVLEDCVTMHATPSCFIPCNTNEVTLLEKADFVAFFTSHDKVNPECGGTSQRIWDKWDSWRVFLLRKNGEIIGYSIILINLRDATMGEIFCVWAENLAHGQALLSAATQCAFENNKNVVVYMIDRDNTNEHKTALAAGYQETGYYVGYRVNICPL